MIIKEIRTYFKNDVDDIKKIIFYDFVFFTKHDKNIYINHNVTKEPKCINFIHLNFQKIDSLLSYYSYENVNNMVSNKNYNTKYLILEYIKLSDELDSNYVITDNGKIISSIINILKKPINFDLLTETHMNDCHTKMLSDLRDDSNRQNIVHHNSIDIKKLFISDEKYWNIVCVLASGFSFSFYKVSFLTKLPNYYLLVTTALSKLRKGGTLYLYLIYTNIFNNAFKKFLYLLYNSFTKYEIYNLNGMIMLNLTGFKDDVSSETMAALRSICLSSRSYNYHICDVMRHFHYLLSREGSGGHALGYSLDLDEVGMRDAFAGLEEIKTMPVLDDVDLDVEVTPGGLYLVYELEKLFTEFDRDVYHKISRYVLQEDPADYKTMYIEPEHKEKTLYERTMMFIRFFERNGMSYNKANLAYIKKYNRGTMNRLYTVDNNIKFQIMAYSAEESSSGRAAPAKMAPYQIEEMDEVQKVTDAGFQVKQSLLDKIESERGAKALEDAKYKVRRVSEDFARGVAQHVSKGLRGEKVSNGFVKLWEIYASVPEIWAVLGGGGARVFHIAEAPGQWIYCTAHWLAVKKGGVDYDWRAMSLNAKHPKNIEKYGDGIFRDQYGFIRNNRARWVYGEDGTGDFTVPENIMWYRKYVRREFSEGVHLVAGDAGMNGESVGLVELQLIDYCQMAMVAACGTVGSSCVTKHFLPYIRGMPESFHASGFFLNLIYFYYLMYERLYLMKPHASNPDSGEFYVVGCKMRALGDAEVEAIVGRIAEFKVNGCFFEKEDIPMGFRSQVVQFVRRLSDGIADQYDIQNTLFTCLSDDSPVIQKELECEKYLGKGAMESVRRKRMQKWLEMYEFELSESV